MAAAVEVGLFDEKDSLPLLVWNRGGGVRLEDWLMMNEDVWEAGLSQQGAVLFRGFQIESVPSFSRVASLLCGDAFANYGDLPHSGVAEGVYRTSPYPADESILLHGEGAHLSRWPGRMAFFCQIAPERGGETTMLDVRTMWDLLDEGFRAALETKGISYCRNFHPGVDQSWEAVFQTTDREKVESICEAADIQWQWAGGATLRTTMTVPARLPHPVSRENLFFHQIFLFHPACLPMDVRRSLETIFSPEALPRNVTFGDGTPMPDDAVLAFKAACEERAFRVPWSPGDVALLDNMRVSHGRRPFEGERRILVGMGGVVQRTV